MSGDADLRPRQFDRAGQHDRLEFWPVGTVEPVLDIQPLAGEVGAQARGHGFRQRLQVGQVLVSILDDTETRVGNKPVGIACSEWGRAGCAGPRSASPARENARRRN